MDTSLLSLLFDLLKSLVGSLSWPITLIICLLILRKQLNALISKIGKLKYGDLEADFSREVRKISVNIKEITPDIIEPEKNSTKTFVEEIEEIANISPKAAIPYVSFPKNVSYPFLGLI